MTDHASGLRPILLVDDDEESHFFMLRDLQKAGIANPTECLVGGAEAIAHLKRCVAGEAVTPAIVFLDVKMPCVNGLDVLEWMNSDPRTRCIPVAMLTSSDDPRDLERAMNSGAHWYLTKPPERTVLARVLRAVNLGRSIPPFETHTRS